MIFAMICYHEYYLTRLADGQWVYKCELCGQTITAAMPGNRR